MDELKRPPRKGSFASQEEDDEMKDIQQEPLDFNQIKPALKQPKDMGEELAGLMKKMQIDVVGRENGKDSDVEDMMEDEDEDDEDVNSGIDDNEEEGDEN